MLARPCLKIWTSRSSVKQQQASQPRCWTPVDGLSRSTTESSRTIAMDSTHCSMSWLLLDRHCCCLATGTAPWVRVCNAMMCIPHIWTCTARASLVIRRTSYMGIVRFLEECCPLLSVCQAHVQMNDGYLRENSPFFMSVELVRACTISVRLAHVYLSPTNNSPIPNISATYL